MTVPNRNPRLTNEHAWPDAARSWKAFDGGTGEFRVSHLIEELANAGFDTRSIWTDEAGDVALLLADVTGAGAAGQTT